MDELGVPVTSSSDEFNVSAPCIKGELAHGSPPFAIVSVAFLFKYMADSSCKYLL